MESNLYNHTDTELKNLWGKKLKKLRLEKNLSQTDLANKTGLSRSSIAEIEKGRNFSIESLLSMLRVFEKLEELTFFLTEEEYKLSPMEIYERKNKARQRGGYNK